MHVAYKFIDLQFNVSYVARSYKRDVYLICSTWNVSCFYYVRWSQLWQLFLSSNMFSYICVHAFNLWKQWSCLISYPFASNAFTSFLRGHSNPKKTKRLPNFINFISKSNIAIDVFFGMISISQPQLQWYKFCYVS